MAAASWPAHRPSVVRVRVNTRVLPVMSVVLLYDIAWRNGLLVLLLAGIGVILSLQCNHAVVGFCCGCCLLDYQVQCALLYVIFCLTCSIQHNNQLRVAIYGAGQLVLNWQLLV